MSRIATSRHVASEERRDPLVDVVEVEWLRPGRGARVGDIDARRPSPPRCRRGTGSPSGPNVIGPADRTSAVPTLQPVLSHDDLLRRRTDRPHPTTARAPGHPRTVTTGGVAAWQSAALSDTLVELARVVPASVEGAIRRRIARLPAETLEVLTAAVDPRRDFDLLVLAAVVGLDGAELLDRLDPAVAAGIVVESPQGLGRSRFSHGLVSETVYQDLSGSERARGTGGRPRRSRPTTASPTGRTSLALAAHWSHAVPAAPPDRGIDAALRAARWAASLAAADQAATSS